VTLYRKYTRALTFENVWQYVSIFCDTVQHWITWDAGALCLLATTSAAAVHESIRTMLLAAGADAALAVCTDGRVSGLNNEALVSLLQVLRHGSSSQAHAEALVRAAGEGTEEDSEEARRRDAAIRAATRRPDAPPHIDAEVAWKMRAESAARELNDLEEAHGGEIDDFGGRLQLRALSQKMNINQKVSMQDLVGAIGGGGGEVDGAHVGRALRGGSAGATERGTAASPSSDARAPAAVPGAAPPAPPPAAGTGTRADAARQDAQSEPGGGLEALD